MAGPMTPSKISAAHDCLHYYYLECFGDRSKLREISEGEDLRMKQGILFEEEIVSKIDAAETIPWEYPDFKTSYLKTTQALKKGPAWIHGGVLLSRNLLGIPDLLNFYDIETLGAVTVVHGVIRVDRGKREERSFYAESLDQEEKIWHEFLNYLSRDRKAIVYSWTFFERSHTEGLWAKYRGNGSGYRLIEQNLTDQCAFVRDHFVLPCRGYSIKQVAPVFGFHRQAEDAGGGNCEAWYGRWLETRDESLRKKIVEYNLDDVRAMEVIDKALRKISGFA